MAEKVYSRRESIEVKEIKKEKRQNQHLASILLAATVHPDEHQSTAVAGG